MNNLSENVKAIGKMIQEAPGRFAALVVLIVVAFLVARFAEQRAMRRELAQGRRVEAMFSTRKIAIIGVFSAISFALMLFEFPILFMAPDFYKFDFSDIPALIAGFAAGPMAGVMIEFIKNLLNILIQGPTPGFVGEIANFVIGSAFIIPATVIYRFKKTRKVALISCITGTLCITFIGAVLNAFFLLPAYAIAYGCPVDYFIAAGTEIHSFINNIFTFCLFCVAPFNLLKGVADSVITFLIYKQLSPILKTDPMEVARARKVAKAEEA